MKFVTYRNKRGEEFVGVLAISGDRVHPLRDLGYDCPSMLALLDGYSDRMHADLKERLSGNGGGVSLDDVLLDAPIPHPRHDILCMGQNYLEHALEAARSRGVEYKKPDYPIYFSKRVNRAVPHNGVIPAHADITQSLDYETELAVVIGKHCDHVKPEDVFRHIFGYTIVNDVSAREVQRRHVQYSFGKGMDGFTPMGPWIVTLDEFVSPPHLHIQTRVNGEARQNANTSEFIFDIPRLISELSAGIVLEPGDILITGTPSGVGMGFTPPRFLKSGDVIECEIESIGVLRNTVG